MLEEEQEEEVLKREENSDYTLLQIAIVSVIHTEKK